MNEDDEYCDPRITPQMYLSSSTLTPISTASISNTNMSMRWWSGTMLHDCFSFPAMEDVRGAICQMQCPERSKEPIDDYVLTHQKSQQSIVLSINQQAAQIAKNCNKCFPALYAVLICDE